MNAARRLAHFSTEAYCAADFVAPDPSAEIAFCPVRHCILSHPVEWQVASGTQEWNYRVANTTFENDTATVMSSVSVTLLALTKRKCQDVAYTTNSYRCVSCCNICCNVVRVRCGIRRDGEMTTDTWQGDGAIQNIMHLLMTALSVDSTGEMIVDTAVDSARSRLPWRWRNWTLAYTTPGCTYTVSVHYYFSCIRRPLLLF